MGTTDQTHSRAREKMNDKMAFLLCFFSALDHSGVVFLDAFSHLYKRVCLSVGPSVRRSVGPSVTHELNF